jgi:hypothetical protein
MVNTNKNYERIVCWAKKRAKNQIISHNQSLDVPLPITFVDSFDEFKENFQEDVFSVIALTIGSRNYRKIRALLNSFPSRLICTFVDGDFAQCRTLPEHHFIDIRNIVYCWGNEFFDLFRTL